MYSIDNWFDAWQSAMDAYTDGVRVSDVLQAYDYDKKAFAHDLALATGAKESSARRNIDRWLNSEKGKATKSSRTPKRSMDTLRNLYARRVKPTNVHTKVRGTIKISEDIRRRSAEFDVDEARDLSDLFDAVDNGDFKEIGRILIRAYTHGNEDGEILDGTIHFEF